MLPILFRLGPLVLETRQLFILLGFLITAFVFWRKAREEHYHEEQVFDAFLLATVVGVVAGRLGFIIWHAQEFGWKVWQWVDAVQFPGSVFLIGIVSATLYLFWYAVQRKWDAFEMLDFWFTAFAAGMVFRNIGNFFAGIDFGVATNLPWGVIFPGVFETHHPTQLYAAVVFVGLFWYLSWVEYRYRTFNWYRAGKKTAQTGYLTGVFLIVAGILLTLLSLIKPAQLLLGPVSVDLVIYGSMALFGVMLLLTRSGRSLNPFRKREPSFND